jgi:hypothetical protein
MAEHRNPYKYTPSGAAAMIFLCCFAIVTIWHIFTIFRRRVWYFTPLAIGGIRKSSSTSHPNRHSDPWHS